MDSSCKKIYCTHEIDVKKFFETYFSDHAPYSVIKESTINMLRAFHNAFCTGMVTGRTVIDCSISPIAYHLFAICDFVEKITILKVNDGCLKELEKWKNKDPDALDWSFATEILESKRNSDELEDKEETLRGKIDQSLKWDPSRGDPADVLLLPKADILLMFGILEMISKDHDDYRRNLRKICCVIKPGGYVLLFTAINCSHFKVGEETYHFLACDESFYRKVLSEEDLEIKYMEKFDRRMRSDVMDHEGAICIIARKVKMM